MIKRVLYKSSPEHLYVNHLKMTQMVHNLRLDRNEVWRDVQQYNIIKNIFWWFYVHVEVDITILYNNWSKNHIGTKLGKQSK